MSEDQGTGLTAPPLQMRYAGVLEKGMYIGLAVLFITYIIYVLGIMKPYVPINELSQYWGKNVHDYLEHANIKAGWHWLGMLRYGDFINFIGIVILAGVTIICYLSILPFLLKDKDKIYTVLVLLEVIILSLAASGILAFGH